MSDFAKREYEGLDSKNHSGHFLIQIALHFGVLLHAFRKHAHSLASARKKDEK